MFMASSDDFFVLRKFGVLNARVALMMQDRIVQMSEELDREDRECIQMGENNGTMRKDPKPRRQEILEQLAWRLERYSVYIKNNKWRMWELTG